jgi:hypothetical protein
MPHNCSSCLRFLAPWGRRNLGFHPMVPSLPPMSTGGAITQTDAKTSPPCRIYWTRRLTGSIIFEVDPAAGSTTSGASSGTPRAGTSSSLSRLRTQVCGTDSLHPYSRSGEATTRRALGCRNGRPGQPGEPSSVQLIGPAAGRSVRIATPLSPSGSRSVRAAASHFRQLDSAINATRPPDRSPQPVNWTPPRYERPLSPLGRAVCRHRAVKSPVTRRFPRPSVSWRISRLATRRIRLERSAIHSRLLICPGTSEWVDRVRLVAPTSGALGESTLLRVRTGDGKHGRRSAPRSSSF